MAERFDYPTAAAATTSLIFGTASQLVGDPDELQFNDDVRITMGGTDRAVDFGDHRRSYTLTFIVPRSSATEDDKSDALTFFQTVKRVNTFQWTDGGSTVRTVRLMSNPVRFDPLENTGFAYYRVTVELREQ